MLTLFPPFWVSIAFGVFVILLLLGICTLVHVDQHDFLRDQPCKKTLEPSI